MSFRSLKHERPETVLFLLSSCESPSADAASRSSSSSLFFGARIFLHLARLSFGFSGGFGERDSRQGGFGHLSGSSPIPLPLANTLEQVADGQKKRKEHLSKKGLKICSPLPLQKRGNSTLGKF